MYTYSYVQVIAAWRVARTKANAKVKNQVADQSATEWNSYMKDDGREHGCLADMSPLA